MTDSERAAASRESARADAEIEACRAHTRKRAQEMWDRARPVSTAPVKFDYLQRKNIEAHGTKLLNRRLLVPMHDINGHLQTVQLIGPLGDKQFLPGGRVQGCFFLIGDDAQDKPLCIAEGFATGATIHEATGLPVAVAFMAQNLVPVAETMRKAHPNRTLLLCGDDDAGKGDNPGRTAVAKACAQRVS